MNDSSSSPDLLRQASGGDDAALGELLARHLPGLRAYVRQRTGQAIRARESVSDLVQSVCREVIQHADRFQYGGEVGFKPWLYKTALRKIANRLLGAGDPAVDEMRESVASLAADVKFDVVFCGKRTFPALNAVPDVPLVARICAPTCPRREQVHAIR